MPRQKGSNLHKLTRMVTSIKGLALQDCRDLQRWLTDHIQELESQEEKWEPPVKAGEVARERYGEWCLILQRHICGKPGCKCAGNMAAGHGPYWFGYSRQSGKLKKKYFGKKKPSNLEGSSSQAGDREEAAPEPVEEECDRGYQKGQSVEVLKFPYSGLKGWEFMEVVEGGPLHGWVECFSADLKEVRKFSPEDVRPAA